MPTDIHETMWNAIKDFILEENIAINSEILDEMKLIDGGFGGFIDENSEVVLLEVGNGDWPWDDYVDHVSRMQVDHAQWISEYLGNKKDTIGLKDISIIALAKALGLPLVSMESFVVEDPKSKKRRIPNICIVEDVEHLTFNEFCRREGLKF